MTLETTIDITANPVSTGPRFSNVSTQSLPGSTNQGEVFYTFTGAEDGVVKVRFKSSYNGTDGKSEIDAAGGFPIDVPVVSEGFDYTAVSAANLVSGTEYVVLMYWESADGLTTFPAGNDIIVSPAFTMAATASVPTSISPSSITILKDTASGTVIGTLGSNATGATFSEGSPDLSLANISANGQVTLAADADTLGDFTLKAIATTSAAYNQDVTISVVDPGSGGGGGGGTFPTVNAGTVSSVSALTALLDAWEADWNGTSAGLGLTNADERVVGLSAGTYGALSLSGYDFSAHERVTILGRGVLSRDAYGPTSTCKFTGDLTLTNCNKLRVMAIQFEGTSGHTITNCTNVQVHNCVLELDKQTSLPGLATDPPGLHATVFNNTTNCEMFRTVHIGAKTSLFRFENDNTGHVLDGMMFDQSGGDDVKSHLASVNDGIVRNCVLAHRARNPGGTHQDAWQNRNNGEIRRNAFSSNIIYIRDHWGSQTAEAYQGFFFGSGTIESGNTFTQNLCVSNNGFIKGNQSGSISLYNTQFMVEGPNGAGFGGIDSGTADYNIVPQNFSGQDQGAGPNGINMLMPNSGGTSGWEEQLNYATGPNFTRTSSIGTVKPPNTTTRSHWNTTDPDGPAGCYQLMERLFDATNHDHHKDWGWPTAPMMHILLDPDNELAGAAGTYTSFDVDGVYLG
jgi:hypothetical protein